MNPKSRMVICLAISLGAAAVWPRSAPALLTAADSPAPVQTQTAAKWMRVIGGGRTYYLLAAKQPKADNQSCELYASVGARQPLKDIRLAMIKGKFYINTEARLAQIAAGKPKPSAPKPAPVSISPEVQALLADMKCTPQQKALYARIFQRIQRGNPQEFARMQKLGKPAVERVIAAIEKLRKASPRANDAQLYAALVSTKGGKKSLLQAALDEAEAAASAQPGPKPGDAAGAPVGPAAGTEEGGRVEDNLVTVLVQMLIKDPDVVGKTMAARFAQYMDKEAGGRFIAAGVRQKADVMKRLMAEPAGWVQGKTKESKAKEAAELYFVMGAGDQAPDWAAANPALARALAAKGTMRSQLLAEAMLPWTAADPKAPQHQCVSGDAPWVHGFLNFAASKAHSILSDTRVKDEIGKGIIDREEKSGVPGGAGKYGGQVMKGAAKGFGLDSLYAKGAKVGWVTGKKDSFQRQISVKIYTVKENGQLVNKIGIYDITNPSDVFGRKFAISTQQGDITFPLDDRRPGMPKYTLKFVPEGSETKVFFSREGNEDAKPTTLRELFSMRAAQAVSEGNVAEVGGKRFLVLGQGGATGSLLFFPAGMKSDGPLPQMMPELVSEVDRRTTEGFNAIISDKRPLGYVNGKHYNLVYNHELALFEAQEGEPPAEPKPTASAGGDAPAQSETGAAAGEGGGMPDGLSDAEKAHYSQGFRANARVKAAMDTELWKETKVLTLKDSRPFAQRHVWTVPKRLFSTGSLAAPSNEPKESAKIAEPAPDEVRVIAKHLLAFTSPAGTMYFDLRKESPVKGAETHYPYESAGTVDAKRNIQIMHEALLDDAMAQAGYSEDVRKAAAQRLAAGIKAYGKNAQFKIESSDKQLMAAGRERTFVFWPAKGNKAAAGGAAGASSEAPGSDEEQPGQGKKGKSGGAKAVTLEFGPDEPLPATPQTVTAEEGKTEDVSLLKMADDKTSALYINKEKSRWYLLFRAKLPDGKMMRTLSFKKVFAKDRAKDYPTWAVPAVQISGMSSIQVPDAGALNSCALRVAGDSQRGVLYAVKSAMIASDQQAVKMKDNCYGPIAWWGISDPKQAQKACERNKL